MSRQREREREKEGDRERDKYSEIQRNTAGQSMRERAIERAR